METRRFTNIRNMISPLLARLAQAPRCAMIEKKVSVPARGGAGMRRPARAVAYQALEDMGIIDAMDAIT
jgi:hypothetical protein